MISIQSKSISQSRQNSALKQAKFIFFVTAGHPVMGIVDSSVVERWTHDQKVSGLSPSMSSGRIFFLNLVSVQRLEWTTHPDDTVTAACENDVLCIPLHELKQKRGY